MSGITVQATIFFFSASLVAIVSYGLTAQTGQAPALSNPGPLRRTDGLQLTISRKNRQPTLLITLPGHSESDYALEIIFPEHVTATKHGSSEAEHLYLFQPGLEGPNPCWRRIAHSFEYERELLQAIHMLARATLEEDGVLFHYEFTNRSSVAYGMIYAVTDPRLKSVFKDVRLERTYVHHNDGFDLLAAETPARLTMPLSRWLPARYLASYTWPVPSQLVERRSDGITYYCKSRAVDEPFIATQSTDRTWVVASFTRETGNVWSNPELTCQHADPQTALSPGQKVALEVKMLVLRGSLDEARQKARRQRGSLN